MAVRPAVEVAVGPAALDQAPDRAAALVVETEVAELDMCPDSSP